MELRPEKRDEVLRQRDRLVADRLSREAAVALSCLLFAVYLPAWTVIIIYAIVLATEVGDIVLYRKFARSDHPVWYVSVLLNSCLALGTFSMLGVLAWGYGDPLVRFAGVISIVGALINVSSARATHLPLGVISGLPPSLALLYIATEDMFGTAGLGGAAFATIAAVGLIGYFGSALLQNHTAQADLALESERAKTAGEAKARFLSGIGHDMRTPLNTVVGLAQTLRDTTAPADIAMRASQIEEAARDLADLVDEMIDLADSPSTVEVRPFAGVVRRELGSIARQIAARHSEPTLPVTVRVHPEVPELARLDYGLVRKILKLVADDQLAGKGAGAAGPVTLDCRLDADHALSVSLTIGQGVAGAGPPPGDDSAYGKRALIERLLPLAKARLACTGQDGSNSATLVFPFDPVPAPQNAFAEPPRMLKALVVDDIATNRFVIVQILRSMEIEAVEAEGGPEALVALADHRFDVVLLDMNMPGMDGEATFRAISSTRRDCPIPVIALTAGGIPGQRERFLGLGMDGFVPKPVDRRILRNEIDTALNRRSRTGTARTA